MDESDLLPEESTAFSDWLGIERDRQSNIHSMSWKGPQPCSISASDVYR